MLKYSLKRQNILEAENLGVCKAGSCDDKKKKKTVGIAIHKTGNKSLCLLLTGSDALDKSIFL